jgi:hypothetical protein
MEGTLRYVMIRYLRWVADGVAAARAACIVRPLNFAATVA